MRFSVVIPLYNKEAYIPRAVRSVLSQTHGDLELIVVDDGSTDGGPGLVAALDDPRVRLVRQPNGGVSRARNAGVLAAASDWVAFLDADDEYDAVFLERVAAFIATHRNRDLSFVGAGYRVAGAPPVEQGLKDGIYDFFDLFRDQHSPNCSSTTAVNRQRLIAVGGFPEGVAHHEDWIAWFKLALVGEFGYIASPLGTYHTVGSSASRAPLDADAYYREATTLLRIVTEAAGALSLTAERRRTIICCLNEFRINTAGTLAYHDRKLLAWKMLRGYRIGVCSLRRPGRTGLLLRHLAAPVILKQAYRKRRTRRNIRE